MSIADRTKWDRRYSKGSHGTRLVASVFLTDWLTSSHALREEIPVVKARALDVACGTGRNAICLAQAGYQVDAIDISSEGLRRGRERAKDLNLHVNWIESDLDEAKLESEQYNVIVLFRYKNIALLKKLAQALRPGGILLCEQHLLTDQKVAGPSGTNFRWHPNELLELVEKSSAKIHIESCFEGLVQDPDKKPAALVRLIVRKLP